MKQKLIFPKKYASSIEVTSGKLCTVSYELVDEGSSNQTINFFITGRAPRNKWKTVGTVKIAVADAESAFFLVENYITEYGMLEENIKKGNMFLKSPVFSRVDNGVDEKGSIKFKLNKITRSDINNNPDNQDGVQQIAISYNENIATRNMLTVELPKFTDSDNEQWLRPPAENLTLTTSRPIIAYTFDIVYKSNGKTNRGNGAKYRLDYEGSVDLNNKKSSGIRDVLFDTRIPSKGGRFKFTVVGDPGSYFSILITERIATTLTEKGGESGYNKPMENKLARTLFMDEKGLGENHIVKLGDGSEFKAIRDKIGANGKFVFYQKFPPYQNPNSDDERNGRFFSVNVLKQGGYNSSTTTIEKDGNQFSDINTKKWDLNRWRNPLSTIDPVRFPLDIDAWDSVDVVQRYDPILKLCVTTGGSRLVTAQVNGLPTNWPAAAQFNVNHPACASFEGRYKDGTGKIYSLIEGTDGVPTQYPWIDMVWKLKSVSSPADAYSSLTQPKFHNANADESNWTNSIPTAYTASVGSPAVLQTFSGNGGMLINMENLTAAISTTSTSNDTLTISCRVHVINWGTENVTMNLNVDDIVTLS